MSAYCVNTSGIPEIKLADRGLFSISLPDPDMRTGTDLRDVHVILLGRDMRAEAKASSAHVIRRVPTCGRR